MPKFVADLSDDDEVVVIPFNKPTPPIILLSESEDEGEDDAYVSSATRLSKTKESGLCSSSSSGSLRAERDGPNQRTGEEWKGKRKEGADRRQKKSTDGGRATETEVEGASAGERSHVDPVGSIDETNSVSRSSVRVDGPVLNGNDFSANHVSTNIFNPSETAILDNTSRNSTPSNELGGESPTTSSPIQEKNVGRRQSTLVKKQFASFLRGLNLPPPPPNGKRKSSSEETPADPDSSTVVTEGDKEAQGFVTVTEETSMSNGKRKRTQKAASAPASSVGSPRREIPIDIQYNLTTTPLDLNPDSNSSPPKPLKKTSRKSKEKESPQTKAAAKKRKQTGRDDSSTSKSKKKERSKSDGANVKRKRMNNDVLSSPGKAKDTSSFPQASLRTTPSAAFPNHWNDEMKKFYGTITGTDFDLETIFARQPDGKRHWRVIVNKKKQRHYSCDICKKWQHKSVHCPQRGIPTRCIYCTDPSHLKDQCGKNICLFCGSKQRKMQQACEKCLFRKPRPSSCSLCSVIGHHIDICPDNWRRYHSTTVDINNVELKLDELKGKLQNEKVEKIGLETHRERGKKTDIQAVKRVDVNITKFEEEIKALDEKIKAANVTNGSVGFKYLPRFQQYCSNCGIKGHNNTMCKSERLRPVIIPNRTYVIRELDSTAPLSLPSTPLAATAGSTSSNTAKVKTPDTPRNRRVVFSPDENGSATITIGTPQSTKKPTSTSNTQNENSRTKSITEAQNASGKSTLSSESTFEKRQSQNERAHTQKQRQMYEDSQQNVPVMTRSSQPKFYEDEMPTSFDIDERTIHRGVSVPPPLFQFPQMQFPPQGQGMSSFLNFPPPPIGRGLPIWSDGSGRIQYPSTQQREVIHIPVPVPVPAEEYERFARHGFPSQFGFSSFFQSNSNPYLNQHILPQFPYYATTPIPKVGGPGVEKSSTNYDPPPSPDSTENVASPPPAEVVATPLSPDIEFLEEVPNTDGSDDVAEDAQISLLPSEWDLFCKDKGKSNLVDTLSRRLGVSIKVCKQSMSITITSGDAIAKNISKRNIVQFLQSDAASIQFKPDFNALPEDIPPSQTQSVSQNSSKNNGSELSTASTRSQPQHQSQVPQDHRHQNNSNYSHNQNTYRRGGFDRNRGNRYGGLYRDLRDDRDSNVWPTESNNSKDRYYRGRGRGNYSDTRGNYDDRGRYRDRNSYQSSRNYNTNDPQEPRRNYDRPRRYFDAQ